MALLLLIAFNRLFELVLVSHGWKLVSTWRIRSHLYHIVLFLCILARLATCHSHVFGLGIFDITGSGDRFLALPGMSLRVSHACKHLGARF